MLLCIEFIKASSKSRRIPPRLRDSLLMLKQTFFLSFSINPSYFLPRSLHPSPCRCRIRRKYASLQAGGRKEGKKTSERIHSASEFLNEKHGAESALPREFSSRAQRVSAFCFMGQMAQFRVYLDKCVNKMPLCYISKTRPWL